MERFVSGPADAMITRDEKVIDAMERQLAVLREGLRSESKEFLKAFDELTAGLRNRLNGKNHDGEEKTAS